MNDAFQKVLKRLHYPLEIMLTCMCWYVNYPLSPRLIEEMMHERGIYVDHPTTHRSAIKFLPVLAAAFRSRKRPVGSSWRKDKTYVLVGGQWKYLCRAVDRDGATVDFCSLPNLIWPQCAAIGHYGSHGKATIVKSSVNTAAVTHIQVDTGAPIELCEVK